MPAIPVKYKCGHEGVEDRDDIENIPKWQAWALEKKVCKSCWMTDKRKSKGGEAVDNARILGLPNLAGSQKQVNWAMILRHQIISGPVLIREGSQKFDPRTNPAALRYLPIQEEQLKEIRGNTSAKWWIDQREKTLEQILEERITAKVEGARDAAKDNGTNGEGAHAPF